MKKESLYFIALIPDEKIEKEVIGIKEYVWEHYQSKASLRSPPHITLHMPFKYPEKKEDDLIQFLGEFSGAALPFPLELDGFGSFPPRVIYIDVIPSVELENIQADLKRKARQVLKIDSPENPHRPFRPHMTIAFRDLKKPKFYEAWKEFESRKIRYEFTVSGIYLLKHNGRTWDKFRFFSFNPPAE